MKYTQRTSQICFVIITQHDWLFWLELPFRVIGDKLALLFNFRTIYFYYSISIDLYSRIHFIGTPPECPFSSLPGLYRILIALITVVGHWDQLTRFCTLQMRFLHFLSIKRTNLFFSPLCHLQCIYSRFRLVSTSCS